MASNTPSAISNATGDTTVGDALTNVSSAWADTVPPGTRSDVSLEQKLYVLKIPQEDATILTASGQWGPAQGNITLYVRLPQDRPVNFAVVTSVTALDASDVFDDAQLAAEVNSHLSGAAANLCVFREWSGIDPSGIAQITSTLPDAIGIVQLIQDIDTASAISPTSKTTGIGISAKVDLRDWDVTSSASLLKRLGDIDSLAGAATTSTMLVLGCVVAKKDSLDGKGLSSLNFTSSINALPVLDSALLKDVSLSLAITRPSGPASSFDAVLSLSGDLVLGIFDSRNPWISKGTLVIDKSNHAAELTVEPAPKQTQGMVDLGVIKLGNVNLHVVYTFDVEPAVACQTSLSVDVTVGCNTVHGTVSFNDTHPSVLAFTVPGTLDVGALFRIVFGSKSPDNLPEFTLTSLDFSYRWEAAAFSSEHSAVPGQPKIEPGFSASAQADLFGINFGVLTRFSTGSHAKDILTSGKLLKPVFLWFVSLYAPNNPNAGPAVTYAARESNAKSLTIETGLSFIGLQFPHIQVRYAKSVKDQQPCLHTKLTLRSPVLPGGGVPIDLEIVKLNGRTHIRLNDIPLTEIQDAFNAKQLFDKIRDLTSKDPCKAIDIPLDDILTNSWAPKIEFSDTQPTPQAGTPLQCSFDVSCVWTLTLLKEKKVVVEMKPFPLVMNVPQTLEELPREIGSAIANSIDKIVQDLLDNVDKFSEILAFYAAKYAAEQWMKAALQAWLCRHKGAPGIPEPGPEPVTTPPTVSPPAVPPIPAPVTPPTPTPANTATQVAGEAAAGGATASTAISVVGTILGILSLL